MSAMMRLHCNIDIVSSVRLGYGIVLPVPFPAAVADCAASSMMC